MLQTTGLLRSIYGLRRLCSRVTPSPFSNIGPLIRDKVGVNLHLQRHHPLCIIKTRIEIFCNAWARDQGQPRFSIFDQLDPVVSTESCFDDLLVPKDHVSRSKSDTYYIDEMHVLRTHTSAHQSQLLASGEEAFLCTGDVFRRDEIDATHYPVFHQMEGVRLYSAESFSCSREETKTLAEHDLKALLTALAAHLFGDVPMRWREDYFPFTYPSFELEVEFNGIWLEVLGCGVVHDGVLLRALPDRAVAGQPRDVAWAFGLGLERLAMVLFGIPDIRLFWSRDERFLSQFCTDQPTMTKFVPYSKFPLCYKDVIRAEAGDMAERVKLIDEFTDKLGRSSHAYRIEYRHLDRSLTNREVDELQSRVRASLVAQLQVKLR